MEIEYKSPTPNSYDRINGPKIKFMHRSSGLIGSALFPNDTGTTQGCLNIPLGSRVSYFG